MNFLSIIGLAFIAVMFFRFGQFIMECQEEKNKQRRKYNSLPKAWYPTTKQTHISK